MKYRCDVLINRPRTDVIAKFDSTENLYKWQPTLKNVEPLSGEQGQAGATMKLVYRERGGEMSMIETIDENRLPDSMAATYTARGVVNPCRNTFTDNGDGTTRWTMETEFKFSGMMAVMAIFMKKAFPKQTRAMMENFKTWAESA